MTFEGKTGKIAFRVEVTATNEIKKISSCLLDNDFLPSVFILLQWFKQVGIASRMRPNPSLRCSQRRSVGIEKVLTRILIFSVTFFFSFF